MVAAFSRAVGCGGRGGRRAAGVRGRGVAGRAPQLRVRMAVHTGEAQLRDERTTSATRSTVVRGSGPPATAVRCWCRRRRRRWCAIAFPTGATLQDLGLHRLKDLGRPEHIWQLVHPDLPSAFPAAALARRVPPQPAGPADAARSAGSARSRDVRRLLDGERLVTLTGRRGVGKTRLALAVAAEMRRRATPAACGGSSWHRSPTRTRSVGRRWPPSAPARSPGVAGRPPARRRARRRSRRCSCWTTASTSSTPAPSWSPSCSPASPAASVLTTSREPLGVPGEITWRVPVAALPRAPERAGRRPDAVAVRRRRPVRRAGPPGPTVVRGQRRQRSGRRRDLPPPRRHPAGHRAGRRPLPAAVAPSASPAELDDRFRLLTGGARTVMARQQTLAASVDWSHDRLDEAEQMTFRRLGVFAGPFPLEAAEAVVAAIGDIDPAEVFDLISRLVDKSLVVADEGRRGEPRYRLLETPARLRPRPGPSRRRADHPPRRPRHLVGGLARTPRRHAHRRRSSRRSRSSTPTSRPPSTGAPTDPPLGLRLLRDVAVAWEDLGRAGDAMAAADRLLTDDNAERYGGDWLAAAWRTSFLCLSARGDQRRRYRFSSASKPSQRERGDEFYRRLARWPKESAVTDAGGGTWPAEQADRHLQAWAPIQLAFDPGRGRPAAAAPVVDRGRCRRDGERHALLARHGELRSTPSWPVRPAISSLPSSSRGTSCRIRGHRGGATPSAV